MARYTGPKTKISRIFGEPILGNAKWLDKNSNPPGQHGAARKRKSLGEYALQLREKQKAKYTYGVLEKQFRKTFEEAARLKGVTGENLIRLLELPASVQQRLRSGGISMGHARALLPLGDEVEQVRLADRVAAEGLSVRALETEVQEILRREEVEDGPADAEGTGSASTTATPTKRKPGVAATLS